MYSKSLSSVGNRYFEMNKLICTVCIVKTANLKYWTRHSDKKKYLIQYVLYNNKKKMIRLNCFEHMRLMVTMADCAWIIFTLLVY